MSFDFKYEVHMHTHEASACGKTPGAEYIKSFMEHGYAGMITTDHFYHGNTAIDRGLAWRDYVEQFCKGYEAAKAEGDKLGFDVFFGWEENHIGDEYLIYGPEKKWLQEHPELQHADQAEYLGIIHEGGGCVVQAHPFRERSYMHEICLHPFQCDAMEVANFGNPIYQDAFAYEYAEKIGKVMTSGSDMHDVCILNTTPCGMRFNRKLSSSMDYADAIRNDHGCFEPIIPEERKVRTKEMINTLPMKFYDENNSRKDIVLYDVLPELK